MESKLHEAAIRAVIFVALMSAGAVSAQTLTVLPVTIQMEPGRMATTLTVINKGERETSIQVRAFAWSQPEGRDQLIGSDELLASPPLAIIAAGATQVVRLVLRQPPQDHEVTYRILLDQIPSPADPGTVGITFRMSIPIFAQPPTRIAPHMQFHVERDGKEAYLVAMNDGSSHEMIRAIAVATLEGEEFKIEANVSPYVLAGVTRRWRILNSDKLPSSAEILRLTARATTGAIDLSVPIVGGGT